MKTNLLKVKQKRFLQIHLLAKPLFGLDSEAAQEQQKNALAELRKT